MKNSTKPVTVKVLKKAGKKKKDHVYIELQYLEDLKRYRVVAYRMINQRKRVTLYHKLYVVRGYAFQRFNWKVEEYKSELGDD